MRKNLRKWLLGVIAAVSLAVTACQGADVASGAGAAADIAQAAIFLNFSSSVIFLRCHDSIPFFPLKDLPHITFSRDLFMGRTGKLFRFYTVPS